MSAIQAVKPHGLASFHNGKQRLAAVIIRAPAPIQMPRLKADKPKVVDEVWDEARVRSFLTRDALDDATSIDYQILLRAYQGMRPGDFQLFINAFVAEGHNVNAPDAHGQTIAAFIARHRHGQEFLEILTAVGAKAINGAPRVPRAAASSESAPQ